MDAVYQFGEFSYSRLRGLWRGDVAVPLPPTASRLLEMLLRADGRTVSKQEIALVAWNGTAVADHSIARAIFSLRSALRLHEGDDLLVTVYGAGYRIAVSVSVSATVERSSADGSLAARILAAHALLQSGRPEDVPRAARELERAVELLPAARLPGRA